MHEDSPNESQMAAAPTVLLVEDEVLTRLALAQYLRACHYRVLEAANAAEAFMVLQSGIPVEVVFTDVNLPGSTDGFALVRWVQRNRPGVATMLTSGMDHAAHAASDLCDGSPYLQKPYEPQQLVSEIQRLLATRRRA